MTDAYSDAELEAMMADLESDLVERKESLQGDSPRRIREAVCAFANDLPDRRRSGVVFVGASDDGRPVGLSITDELLLQLADVKTDGNIVPPPTLTVGKRILFRQSVARIVHRRRQASVWVREEEAACATLERRHGRREGRSARSYPLVRRRPASPPGRRSRRRRNRSRARP